MIHVLVVSHGQLAAGMVQSAQMIVGEQEGLDHLTFAQGAGAHELAEELNIWLSKHHGPVLICCDMLGGTPFNVAATAAHGNDRLQVWYGINLPVLLEALMKRKDDLQQLITQLVKVAPASAGHANI